MCGWYYCSVAGKKHLYRWSCAVLLSSLAASFVSAGKPTASHYGVLIWSEIHCFLALSSLGNISVVKPSPLGVDHKCSLGCRRLLYQQALKVAEISCCWPGWPAHSRFHAMPQCRDVLTTSALTKPYQHTVQPHTLLWPRIKCSRRADTCTLWADAYLGQFKRCFS